MKFILKINDCHTQTVSGLELVDMISEKLGTTVPAQIVIPATFSLSQEIELTEEEARECGHFKNNCYVSVYCTVPYTLAPTLVTLEPEEGEVEGRICFSVEAKLDFEKFWEEWRQYDFDLSL